MTRLHIALLAVVAFFASFAGSTTQASAASVNVGIQVGGAPPPPPPNRYRQWRSPYRSAVWIPGHNEWINGRWVWIGGYYTYPPHRGGYWVQPRYRHGYWRY